MAKGRQGEAGPEPASGPAVEWLTHAGATAPMPRETVDPPIGARHDAGLAFARGGLCEAVHKLSRFPVQSVTGRLEAAPYPSQSTGIMPSRS